MLSLVVEARSKNQLSKECVSSLPVATSLDAQVLPPNGHGFRQLQPEEIHVVFV